MYIIFILVYGRLFYEKKRLDAPTSPPLSQYFRMERSAHGREFIGNFLLSFFTQYFLKYFVRNVFLFILQLIIVF